jgi:hypothetical protein
LIQYLIKKWIQKVVINYVYNINHWLVALIGLLTLPVLICLL